MISKHIKISIVFLSLLALAIPSNVQGAPSGDEIPPYPDAPLCDVHDPSDWHGLWDSIKGCHYDHQHGADPHEADSVFMSIQNILGLDVGVPWISEKHQGYKYYVNLKPYPMYAQESYDYLNPRPNYVTAFVIQHHDAGGNRHITHRFHSYYMGVQIESLDHSQVGYAYFGGAADFGCMHLPYKQAFLLLPDDPLNPNGTDVCGSSQSIHADPYRAASTLDDILNIQNALAKGQVPDNKWIWTSHDRYGYNRLGYFFFRDLDASTGMDRNDPFTEHYVCTTLNCPYNNSIENVFNVVVQVPATFDFDGDGLVNYVGYTDEKGNIVEGCSTPSTGCIPVIFSNAPVGSAIWSRNTSGPRPEGEQFIDRDIYFNGASSGWIQYQENAPNPPAPTSTPLPSGPFVSIGVDPTSLTVGEIAKVSVGLNNIPAEGYKSAEFTCNYNAGLVEKSDIIVTDLFGADTAVAIYEPQNGTFIVAMAGTNDNRAMTGGTAFTFNATSLQVGQPQIQCTARVSKGDNVPISLPSTESSFTVHSVEPSPTPSPDSSLSGQVIASKTVKISLFDANDVAVTSIVANPDGTFNLTPDSGNYTLSATASGFLSYQGAVTITAGNYSTLPTINLLAGDVDGNNVIDQFDALTIGMNYTSSTPAAADLNNDGVIDFLDLELLAENYRKVGPLTWE